MSSVTRREMIKTAAAAAAAGMSSACARDAFPRVLASVSSCGRLTDIEHVVIFIQENRSFDHYFGSYRGVRGFAEQSPAFRQPDPANTTDPPVGALLPFHLDTSKLNAACTHDITHDWVPQHQSWHGGAMDGFVTSRLPLEARGISWKVYQTPDASVANNLLWFFKKFQNPLSPLYRKAFLPNYPVGFAADALAGTLPQVSWVLAPLVDSEHPPAPSIFGEN